MQPSPFPRAGGWICTPGWWPGWGRGVAKHRPLRACGALGCAGDGGCPAAVAAPSHLPLPSWIQPHAPSSAHPWVADWVSVGTMGWVCSPLAKRRITAFLKGRGCLCSSKAAPPPALLGLGMNRGIVLVLDEAININYANQPLPAHPCLHNIPGQGETEAESIYSLSRSLPLRTSLSKELQLD